DEWKLIRTNDFLSISEMNERYGFELKDIYHEFNEDRRHFKRIDGARRSVRCVWRRGSRFDGHTEFYRFTPEEKLMWLSQIAQFVIEARA
ncbi:MAG: hypothetical protein ACUVRP_07905, partial [Chlorobiales bacterium]